ncbi:MAG: hypothetical protein V3V62_12945 [bacterium]
MRSEPGRAGYPRRSRRRFRPNSGNGEKEREEKRTAPPPSSSLPSASPAKEPVFLLDGEREEREPRPSADPSFDVAILGGGLAGWAAAARLAVERLRVLLLAPPAAAGGNGVPQGPLHLGGLHRGGLWQWLFAALDLQEKIGSLSRAPDSLQVLLPGRRIDVPAEPGANSFEFFFPDGGAQRIRDIYQWAGEVEGRLRSAGLAAPAHKGHPDDAIPSPLSALWLRWRFGLPFRSALDSEAGPEAGAFLDAQGSFFFGKPLRQLSQRNAALALSAPRMGLWRIPGGGSRLEEWLEGGIAAGTGEVRRGVRHVSLERKGRRQFRLVADTEAGHFLFSATHVICEPGFRPEGSLLSGEPGMAVWRFTLPTETIPESLAPRSLIVADPAAPPEGPNLIALEHAPVEAGEPNQAEAAGGRRKGVSFLRAWVRAERGEDPDRLAARLRRAVEGPIPFLPRYLIAEQFDPPRGRTQKTNLPRRVWPLSAASMEECFAAGQGVRVAERILRVHGG